MRIEARDGSGSFEAYRVGAEGARPAIIVLQEVFGVNAEIRAKVDEWAAAGYLAVAPDLFWRIEPGVDIEPTTMNLPRALGIMGRTSLDDAVADIEATIAALRADAGCDGHVGVVGYCWGGLLAYLAATRTGTSASVGYYGVRIDTHLREAHAIAKPLMLHIADDDSFVAPSARDTVIAELGSHPKVEIHRYGAGHAFARLGGEHFDAAAASAADARTAAFFARHLGR